MESYMREPPPHLHQVASFSHTIKMSYQHFLDVVTPYPVPRWMATAFMLICYCCRIYIVQGFHVVSYVLGIFLLNRLIGFMSPKFSPEGDPDGNAVLPTRTSGEFRPFMRRVSELKTWSSTTIAIGLSLIATFIGFLDIPVFWPILVIYFFLLFYVTMKQQIMHMVKYRYLPFTYGKPRYQSSNR